MSEPAAGPMCGGVAPVAFKPVEVFEGAGELQARQEEHRLQELLQPLQSLHAAARRSAGLDHLVDVLSKTLTHLHNITWTGLT